MYNRLEKRREPCRNISEEKIAAHGIGVEIAQIGL